LVHMTDWALYKPSEMIAVTGIRSIHGENRWLIEAPGHLIGPDETELGISLFALSASFGWTAYLYSPLDSAILLNWEGEIFDYWTDNQQALSEMRKILVDFDLSETNQAEQTSAGQPATAPNSNSK